jgi:hypothetical protein
MRGTGDRGSEAVLIKKPGRTWPLARISVRRQFPAEGHTPAAAFLQEDAAVRLVRSGLPGAVLPGLYFFASAQAYELISAPSAISTTLGAFQLM